MLLTDKLFELYRKYSTSRIIDMVDKTLLEKQASLGHITYGLNFG